MRVMPPAPPVIDRASMIQYLKARLNSSAWLTNYHKAATALL